LTEGISHSLAPISLDYDGQFSNGSAADAVGGVVENYVGVEAESFVLAAVGEGVGDNFGVWALVNTEVHSTIIEVRM
jgi:hypothetical protein